MLFRYFLLIHMDEILPPGIFVEFEEACVIEQAEAVGDFPFDLKIGGVERLSLQWCGRDRAQEQKNQK